MQPIQLVQDRLEHLALLIILSWVHRSPVGDLLLALILLPMRTRVVAYIVVEFYKEDQPASLGLSR